MNNAYYRQHAQRFYDDTVNVDMSMLYQTFIACLPHRAHILDGGCGSGRDSKAFRERGFTVEAFDASAELATLARQLTGKPVKQMRFQDLDVVAEYDGIWCCASLLHVPEAELPDVMARLARALKPGGVLYLSFKYGCGEREKDGRRFTDMNEARLKELVGRVNANGDEKAAEAVFSGERIKSWITDDLRPGRNGEAWLNALVFRSEIKEFINTDG